VLAAGSLHAQMSIDDGRASTLELTNLLWLKSALVLAAFLLFGFWERLLPAEGGALLVRLGHATRTGMRRLGRNLSLFGFNALLSPLIVLPVTGWASSFGTGLRPAFWSGAPGLLVDILLLDLWLYWWHRANHEWPLLWRFHEVHHLDETLDTTSAVRFHFGEVVLSALVRVLPIIVLDIPLASVVLFEGLVLAATLFHHSDARLPAPLEQALARVVITPGIHWVHHHARRTDTDSNYGTLLSIWDPLFGSRSRTARWHGMPIGVERRRDRALLQLLVAPFRAQPRAKATAPSARQ
jgi:sterol desaturase/sphingolipid hydroxylase (fatty acid hydroxylase superfamily)